MIFIALGVTNDFKCDIHFKKNGYKKTSLSIYKSSKQKS